MSRTLVAGCRFQFTPNPPWLWSGWTGIQPIPASPKTFKIENKPVILPPDIYAAAMLLIGRAYISPPYVIPGTVTSAQIVIIEPSLSSQAKCHGMRIATQATHGTFTCTVAPALMPAPPGAPVPDPVVVKTGTWSVVMPNQSKATTT